MWSRLAIARTCAESGPSLTLDGFSELLTLRTSKCDEEFWRLRLAKAGKKKKTRYAAFATPTGLSGLSPLIGRWAFQVKEGLNPAIRYEPNEVGYILQHR